MTLGTLSLVIVLVEAISYGSISDKGVVLFLFWGLVFSFIFLLTHSWIKHTKYIGSIGTIVAVIAMLLKYNWKV